MIKAIIKGFYSGRVIEEKQFENFSAAEDYVFTKYNSVWDIYTNGNDYEFYFEVYQD